LLLERRKTEDKLHLRIVHNLVLEKMMGSNCFWPLQILCIYYLTMLNNISACAVGACHMLHPATAIERRQRMVMAASSGVFVAGRHYLVRSRKPLILLMGVCLADRIIKQQQRAVPFFRSADQEKSAKEQEEAAETKVDGKTAKPAEESLADEAMSSAMVASIGFYKQVISPLLPPACRFLPTCSQYGVQAIEKFGPCKGATLIAWRLLRCSPFGGKRQLLKGAS
jgi:putative membrane protein insertion efficiency factor